jgi:hypothetical protein
LSGSDAKVSERRGKAVVMMRMVLEEYTLPMLEGDAPGVPEAKENTQRLIEDGYVLADELAELCHRERSARDFDRRWMNHWMKTASKISRNSMRTLDREMKRQGIGPYEGEG